MADENTREALETISRYLESGRAVGELRDAGWGTWIDYLEAEGFDLRTGNLQLTSPSEQPVATAEGRTQRAKEEEQVEPIAHGRSPLVALPGNPPMEVAYSQVSRYATFLVADEAEAVSAIERASRMAYQAPPKVTGFNDDGFLTGVEAADSETGLGGEEDFVDETIHLAIFGAGNCLLTIELYDELLDPNEPLHPDNIVLAKMLERLAATS